MPDYKKDRQRRRRSLVGAGGFEPPTPCTPCKCATGLRYAPNMSDYSAPGGFLQGTNNGLPRDAPPPDHIMVDADRGILCGFLMFAEFSHDAHGMTDAGYKVVDDDVLVRRVDIRLRVADPRGCHGNF